MKVIQFPKKKADQERMDRIIASLKAINDLMKEDEQWPVLKSINGDKDVTPRTH